MSKITEIVREKALRDMIEETISEGVINGEEVDLTTSKIMKLVKPVILLANDKFPGNSEA